MQGTESTVFVRRRQLAATLASNRGFHSVEREGRHHKDVPP